MAIKSSAVSRFKSRSSGLKGSRAYRLSLSADMKKKSVSALPLRAWVHLAIVTGLIFLSALTLVVLIFMDHEMIAKIEGLIVQKQRLMQTYSQLLLEKGAVMDHHRIERMAHSQLGMDFPHPGQTRMIHLGAHTI